MKQILLDVSEWHSKDDGYASFFNAVGAPSWHGLNFNALNDSIGTGSINEIEVPYEVVLLKTSKARPDVRQFVEDFADLLRTLHERGCPVEVTVKN